MSIESVMPSNHLILCHPLLLLPSIFPSIKVFSNESALRIRWPKCWSFGFNIRLYSIFLKVILIYSYCKILAIFPMLYNIILVVYSIPNSFYLLVPYLYLASPSLAPLLVSREIVLYIYESASLFLYPLVYCVF